MKNLKEINCVMFDYTCDSCKTRYKAPVFTGGYGQFLLNSIGGSEYAWLEAVSSDVFKEVGNIIKNHSVASQLGRREQARLHQKIVGYAFDRDSEGNYFGIDVQPLCPSCGNQRPAKYSEVSPRELVAIQVADVSSTLWSRLSIDERKAHINQKIEEDLKSKGKI